MEEQALQFVTYYEKQLEIAKRFIAIRKSKKVSQQRLSILSGVSYGSIRRFEKTGDISLASLVKLAMALQLYDDLDKLLEEHKRFKKEEAKNNAWMKDILFDVDGVLFSYRVGGVLIKDNKILLTKGGDDYSLPGGHSQIGETSQETIVREFKEETGLDVEPLNVISTYENFWKWGDKNCHQLCIYYRLKVINENQELVPNPDTNDTKFIWLELEELKNINLYPIGISAQILNNITDTTHFIYKE